MKLTSVLETEVKVFYPNYSNPPIINFWKVSNLPPPDYSKSPNSRVQVLQIKMTDLEYIRMHLFKGTVMQNEKVLINDPLGVIQN